jgi:hypothetical protein
MSALKNFEEHKDIIVFPTKYVPPINQLEDKDILSDEQLTIIDKLLFSCPHIVFGGSIALNAVGLIKRKINDIDVFLTNKEAISKSSEILKFIHHECELNTNDVSESSTDVNGNLIRRTGFKYNNVKICVFQVDELELQHSIITVHGRKLRIQNVNHAINAKRAYADKTNKHKDDLTEINKNLDDLPF